VLEGETVMEYRRTSLPTADELAMAQIGTTALCGSCATLIRFHPGENVWRHAILGLDHAPEPFGAAFAASSRARRIADDTLRGLAADPPISESERRAIDGNR
jgi:hypothetical protein